MSGVLLQYGMLGQPDKLIWSSDMKQPDQLFLVEFTERHPSLEDREWKALWILFGEPDLSIRELANKLGQTEGHASHCLRQIRREWGHSKSTALAVKLAYIEWESIEERALRAQDMRTTGARTARDSIDGRKRASA